MADLFTVGKNTNEKGFHYGIEIHRQNVLYGRDKYAKLSRIYTGKDEQIVYLGKNRNIPVFTMRNGFDAKDVIFQANLKTLKIQGDYRPIFIEHNPESKVKIIIAKYDHFHIINGIYTKDRFWFKPPELGYYHLIELKPGEEFQCWNENCPKSERYRSSYDELIPA